MTRNKELDKFVDCAYCGAPFITSGEEPLDGWKCDFCLIEESFDRYYERSEKGLADS